MQREAKSSLKSQLLKVGFFFLIIGIIICLLIPFGKLKSMVFDEMRLAIYQEQINQNNETINNVNLDYLTDSDGSSQQPQTEEPQVQYTYIGELSIPSIRFKRGFVDKNSRYNNINYNITIADEADYPDVEKGNFILMAHSGDAIISFFENLYKLEIGDVATVSYRAKAYYYKLVRVYEQPKTGQIAIFRDYNKKTLTLITCTHNNDSTQSIYIFEETNE